MAGYPAVVIVRARNNVIAKCHRAPANLAASVGL
jgi:hypothetical protein